MTRTGRRGIPVLIAALAVLALAVGVFTTHAQPAHAADATITSLLSRLDVGFSEFVQGTYHNQRVGYDSALGSMSHAGFSYPAGFGPLYTIEALTLGQEGNVGEIVATGLVLSVRGTVVSTSGRKAPVLPMDADITLHLEGDNFTRSYSLDNPDSRTDTGCFDENGTERPCKVGESGKSDYAWRTNLPPLLTDGESILVRLRYKAPRPGTPGTPTVTVPMGKSGALIVNWTAPSSNNPAVLGYQVDVTRGSQLRRKTVDASTTRLPVLLLEPDTAYDVRVRARTALAAGPWSNTARARTNPLQGTNRPQVTLDLNGVTRVKEGDGLPKRLKVTGMPNLHLGAFPESIPYKGGNYEQSNFVEFRVLDGIADSFTYEDHPGGGSVGAFYAGALTIGEDGEVYHDKGYLVIPAGMSAYGPLYIWLGRGGTSPEDGSTVVNTGKVTIGSMERQCVEIADSSNNVPSGRNCPSVGMSGHAVDRLTARFVGVPRSHDGESEFTLRVAFIKDVGISPTSLREDALTVTGGTVTQAQRVDNRSDLFEITVEPDSDEDVTITLPASSDCAVAGAICTEGEDPKKLYNSPAATVSGPTLTASFQGLPSQHDGETAFSFRIAFSEEIATGEEEFRDHSVEVWGGRVTRAEPVDQRRDLWEVEVEPASDDLVMISLRPSLSCDETGAVCTAGGRRLSVSPATMVAGPATWPVQVNGEAQVGKTLTADTSNISDRFGVQVTSMTYQWLANNVRIPGAGGQSYTLGEGKQGRKISVMATYTDDRGNEDTLTSGPTEPVAARERNSRATGLPLISGRALVGQTLTADTSLIFDADGLENSVFSYLWEADDDSIPGATDPTYTPVQADVGKVITVIVSFLDDAGYGQSMTSPATMAVTTAEAAAKVEFAHSLRYAANADGSVSLYWNAPDDEVTGYRILRRRSSMGEPKLLVYVADTGSAATAYTDTEVTAGVPHNYRVQAISDSGLGERSDYIKVFPLRKAANSPATGAPAISGVAQVGETLTADTSGIVDADGLENVTQNYLWGINKGLIIGAVYGYQWLADEAEIEDATGSTYILADVDEGKAVKVRVSFTDDGGHRETLTSAATAAVTQPNTPATGMPTVSGKARVGETLTVDTSGISDENGLDDATFTHQWITDDSVVVGTGTRAYTPTGGDQGKAVKVRVSFSDDAGNWETRTSAQTAAVAARSNSAGICDRTERVRDNIISLLNAQDLGSLGIKDCSEVTDEHLTRIRFLDLTGGGLGQKITSLKSGDFEGLSGMTELGLEHNSLSELPEGVFDGLSSLEILTMQGNDLGSLPDGVFDDLTNLDALALYDNDLAALPDWVFDELTELSTLAISDNKLTALPGDVFTGLAGLTRLVASNNKLTALPDGVFSGMPKLQTVSLSGNPGAPFTLRADLEKEDAGGVVVKVAEGAPFAMTVTLSAEGGTLSATTVVIDGGDTESAVVTVTPEGAGAVTVSVDSAAFPDAGTSHAGIQAGVGESLTLEAAASGICDRTAQVRDAILEKLPDTSDCAQVTETDLRSIDRLWLREKEITSLKSGDFSGLSNLQLLNLADNELRALPDGIFDNLTSLQILYLYTNRLSELPDGIFDDLTGLEELQFFNNHIRGLPDGVFDNLTGLQGLRLGGNWISELPDGVFDNLTGLYSLSLGANDLTELPDGVFNNLTRLYSLNVGGNDLTELPDGIFDELTGLSSLTLSNIEMSELPDGIFEELTRLGSLSLSDNELSELPDGIFDELTGLWSLKLDGNDLSELPDGVFDKLTRLRWLHLHGNDLSEMPDGVFDNLTELEDLYLLRNELSRLPDGIFYGLANLNVLNVDDNAGSPFILTAELERTGENTIVLKIAQATPFDMEVTLSAEGGSLSSATVFIPAGNVSSAPVNVSPDGDDPVTISVVSAAFLLGESQEAKGIQTGLGDPLTLGEDSDTNTPATGAPSVSGTIWVGETLSTDTSDIEDANGLANATFSYRWVSSDGATDTDIENATDSTYKLVAADQGKAIKVRVSFIDDVGNEESLTSEATDAVAARPNSPATGLPTITGTAVRLQTLTADTSGIQDANGMENVAFRYQWFEKRAGATYSDRIDGETSASYRLKNSEVGSTIWVRVYFTDDAGNEESLDSAPTATVASDHGDTPATATELREGSTPTSTTNWESRSGYFAGVYGDLPSRVDQDWFRLNITQAQTGYKEIYFFNDGDPNIRMALYDSSVSCLLGDCETDNGRWGRTYFYLEPGIYYIRMTGPGGNSPTDSNDPDRYYYLILIDQPSMTAWYDECAEIETGFADPLYGCQTNLFNQDHPGEHINVEPVWDQGILGEGINVVLVDSGVDYTHEDLSGVTDLGNSTTDRPETSIFHAVTNSHGTSMASIIAAQHNSRGVRGIAPHSRIFSYYSGNNHQWPAYSENFQEEWLEKWNLDATDVAVSSNSWAFQGNSLGAPSNRHLTADTILRDITQGFHGKGTLYIFSANYNDNSNYSETLNYYAVTTVCAVAKDGSVINWYDGQSNNSAGYGHNLWVCAPSHAVTAVLNNGYELSGGTSVAAATVSGVAALVRSANRELTWRDVKLILANSARQNDIQHEKWSTGAQQYGGGTDRYHFNPNYGFGVVDAAAAVALAKSWTNLPPMTEVHKSTDPDRSWSIPEDTGETTQPLQVSFSILDDGRTTPEFIEHVEINIHLDHESSRDLDIWLTSPSGTVSRLSWPTRVPTLNSYGLMDPGSIDPIDRNYSFGSSKYLGENPVGQWTISVIDRVRDGEGTAQSASITIRGHRHAGDAEGNAPASGIPTIDGTVEVGQSLNVDTSTISDEDGLTNAVYRYQWIASDRTADTEISGATGAAYTLEEEDVGKAIWVRVTFTDDEGNEERLTSTQSAPVAARPNTPATGLPTISGTAQVAETLTASISDIEDADGLTGATFSYQWVSSDGITDTDIREATSATYTLVVDAIGKTITARVNYMDDRGFDETLTSAPTTVVEASPNIPATGLPSITGAAEVGETLTVSTSGMQDANGLSGATFSYQWVSNDGTADMNIEEVTSTTYTLVADDIGKTIKVRVSFTDDGGNEETLTSAPTAAVEAKLNIPATGLPTIRGRAQVGETLTADASGIADHNGLENANSSYQWLADDTAIDGATGREYTLAEADKGKAIKVRVSFTDDGGNEETLTSAPTAPVWGDGPPGAPGKLTITPGDREVTLSWEPPDDNGNPPVKRYRIEWRIDGKDYGRSQRGISYKTTYTKTHLANGVNYFFRVKAENGNGNSYGPYGPASEEVSGTPTSGLAVDLGTPVLSNTKSLHHGMVQLDWEGIEGVGWYVVQYYHVKGGEWLDLPAEGVDIAFHGSSAVVSNLPGLSWLRVRAMSCAGESEWSQIEELYGTKASDWEDVPVPEVAEGDQIDPCPVVLGTPVLSGHGRPCITAW